MTTKRMALFAAALTLAVTFSALAAENANPQSDARPVKVFLCSGQSNMVGTGHLGDLDPGILKEFPASDILYWWESPIPKSPPPYRSSNGWAHLTANDGGFGPDRLFALEMRKAFPNDTIAIAKTSKGGTPIDYWMLDPKSPHDQTCAQSLVNLIKNVAADLDQQKAAGKIPGWQWAGFLWMQGEAEANNPLGPKFPPTFVTYDAKFAQLVSAVRELTGQPDLPVVLGRVSIQLSPNTIRDSGVLRVTKSKHPDAVYSNDLIPFAEPPDARFTIADHLDDGQKRGPVVAVRNQSEKYLIERKTKINRKKPQQNFCTNFEVCTKPMPSASQLPIMADSERQ